MTKLTKIEKEKKIIEKMIKLYCRYKEGNKNLCDGCRELTDYSFDRLDNCPFQEKKPSCKGCPIQCFRASYRTRICKVMNFSSPRIWFYFPLESLKHVLGR